ncbi:hypothetical protein G7046_g7367 [Stylonectria norvegica]|nr:hypothetical protein G7046_g7367 [Stylonectria norvegica]
MDSTVQRVAVGGAVVLEGGLVMEPGLSCVSVVVEDGGVGQSHLRLQWAPQPAGTHPLWRVGKARDARSMDRRVAAGTKGNTKGNPSQTLAPLLWGRRFGRLESLSCGKQPLPLALHLALNHGRWIMEGMEKDWAHGPAS